MSTRIQSGSTASQVDLPSHRDGWPRFGIAVGVSALAGVLTALGMPRGPVTPLQVAAGMATGFMVGGVAGYILRSRWAILLMPSVFVLACEVSRIAVAGPTVDRPDLSTTFGLLVLVLGRGFQGVIQLVPMMLGAAVGVGWVRRTSGSAKPPQGWHRGWLWTRRVMVVMITAALAVLGAVLIRPGFTEPILDAGGKPIPGSVAELAEVRLGGHEQTVLIRGRSTANPVLLYLAGGPGQSDFGYTRAYMSELEDDFVFAVWDQRGTGTSYAELDPVDTLTLDRTVIDTVELASYLRERFDKQKIYLMGSSWGTTLGVLAVQRAPELFQAWIGTGQMASQLASDRIIYQQVLDYAASTNDQSLTERMRGYGPPPYRDMYAYAFLIGYYDKVGPYQKSTYFQTQGPEGIDGTGAVEYGPLDKINKEKAIIDMASVMYPQLQDVDFRTQVPELDVPVYLIEGAHELSARIGPAREWFEKLQAPIKRWITFENSGHIPQFEEFPRFRAVLAEIVGEQP